MNEELTRTCPFNDCGKAIDANIFACGRHWRSLGPGDKAAIYDCFAKWRSGEIDGDELRRRQQNVLGLRGTA